MPFLFLSAVDYCFQYHACVLSVYNAVAVYVSHLGVYCSAKSDYIFQHGGSVECVKYAVVTYIAGEVSLFAYHYDILAASDCARKINSTVSAYL